MITRGVGAIPLVVLVVAAAAAPAHADDYSLHVTGALQAAWTDNLFSTDTPDADLYYQLRPGALATYETPRSVWQADYQLEADLYQQHNEAWSLQHLAGLRGFFLTSPRTELTTALQLSTGSMTALAARGAAGSGQLVAIPSSGPIDVVSVSASENLTFTATPALRLTQGARAQLFDTSTETTPMTSTHGVEAGVTLGGDRGWRYSAVALTAGAAYVRLTPNTRDTSDQMYGTLVASWRRDLGRRWTAMLDAGATTIVPLDSGDSPVVQPTLGGQVTYTPAWGSAGLQVRRTVAPNLFIAQSAVTDTALVNGRLPLPWLRKHALEPALAIEATVGAQHNQFIDTTGAPTSSVDVLTADAAVSWLPRNGVAVALRYQHTEQLGNLSPAIVPSYSRNTVMISVTGRFPDALAAEVPTRDSLRVDRSDVTPVGEEVPAGKAPGDGGSAP